MGKETKSDASPGIFSSHPPVPRHSARAPAMQGLRPPRGSTSYSNSISFADFKQKLIYSGNGI